MARSATNVERNTFIRGLVTEAGPLTFPENASKDEVNMILNKDGSRQRRLGIDYESNFATVDTGTATSGIDTASMTTFRWDNVGNDADISIGVLQIADRLWFFDMTTDNPSANTLNGGSSITITTLVDTPFQYASVNGVLVIVGDGLNNPVKLEYDSDTDTVTQSGISIEVRDIWGVDDSLGIDERPATLSAEHEYNLKNQGWDNTKISAFFSSQAVYPSNADIWHLGKDSNDDFDPTLLVKQDFGTTQSAKGRFILEAFERGVERDAASGLSLPTDTELGNISTAASFAGRIFYAGIDSNIGGGDDNSPHYSGTIFFSQIIDNNEKLGFCFQEGDPTAEYNADLVSSDGGTIQIPEAAGIVKLIPKENSLLVFAENGVWLISGSEGLGFTALDYAVRKVTNVGAVNADSIVDVDGTVVYWSVGGIYQLTPDQRSGRLVAQNLTERTIQTRYNEIPYPSKRLCKGIFDSPSRQVKWIYNDSDGFDGSVRPNSYTKELVLDFVLGAFYILEIKEVTNGPYVCGMLQTVDFISSSGNEAVLKGADVVQVGVDDVVVPISVRSRGTTVTKFVTIIPGTTDSITMSSYKNPDFLDWETFDGTGVDAAAYLLTGEEIFGDTQRQKQVPYLTVHCKRTESGFAFDINGDLQPLTPSSCLVQARWDFADHANSGKFGTQFEAYRLLRNYISTGVGDAYDYGQEVITTKTKLRGSGKALSLLFSTSPGKDLYLYGWGMFVDGNTSV